MGQSVLYSVPGMSSQFSCNQDLKYQMPQLGEVNSSYSLGNYQDTNLNNNNNSGMVIFEENLAPGYLTFAQLPLLHWGPQNCTDWGYHICQKYNIDRLHIDISALSLTNGQQLVHSTERDFCTLLGDQYGPTFYKE